MKIMVAFLGNKKKKMNVNNRSFNNKRVNKNEFDFSSIVNLRKKSTFNNINNNKINVNGIKKRNIYARVVSNDNKILKDSSKRIDKGRAIDSLDEIINRRKENKTKFKSIKEYNNIEKLNFKLSKLINFMLISIPLCVALITNNTIIKNGFIKFYTNFRQAENTTFHIADLVKNYGLYNVNNYIINEKIEEKIEKAETVIITSDEEIIDKEAEIEDVAAFLGNEKVNVEITENSNSIQRVTIGNTKILNYSSKRDIDYQSLLNLDVILTKKSDKILLYNTHTSESYTNSDDYQFEYTGTMRTTDAEYNMLAIAKRFNENLKDKGFESVQDTTPHDYGTYTSAYAKSRITVKDALNAMNGAGIIIDVHRDASSDLAFRPIVNIKGVQVAQLMFVVGVGSSSSPNNNWQDNLKLALKLQQLADKVYPGLFRPMIIRNSVYNQDLNKYALLIEFGATGNTIEEVKLSTRCMTNLLNIMYKD